MFGSPLWVDGDPPLPVELTSFTAAVENNKVTLNWQTATEVNNYGFEIERAFVETQYAASLQWKEIGFVEGHGNSNSKKKYSFVDVSNLRGKVNYRLKQIDNDGTFIYSDVVEAEIILPTQFEMYQNYPNPFNPVTIIKFDLPVNSAVKIVVYNTVGEQVDVLVDEIMPAGFHKIQFSANRYASGVYIYRMQSSDFVKTKKMLLIK